MYELKKIVEGCLHPRLERHVPLKQVSTQDNFPTDRNGQEGFFYKYIVLSKAVIREFKGEHAK